MLRVSYQKHFKSIKVFHILYLKTKINEIRVCMHKTTHTQLQRSQQRVEERGPSFWLVNSEVVLTI